MSGLSNSYIAYRTTGEPCTTCEWIDCVEAKCKIQCHGSGGEHCTSCYDEDHPGLCNACIIIDCQGGRCRRHHYDGTFVHCRRCFPEHHQHTDSHTSELVNINTLNVIQCETECGIHYRGKGNRVLHCDRCFPIDVDATARLLKDTS